MMIVKLLIFFYVFIMLIIPRFTWANSLSLHLSGRIETLCNLDLPHQVDIKANGTLEKKNLAFNLYCNQPFSISLHSINGGMKYQGSNDVTPYFLNLDIDKTNINSSFRSQDIITQKVINSSSVIPFSTTGTIGITLESPLYYAGHYEDIIEVDLIPSFNNVPQP